tara:strand:+ start:1700 stop:2674 length:975 start_codon:yes stop_codon:yes gene_type:complete
MNFLVVGLGSMGKRRIRCLKALGYNEIIGLDRREDRRAEVKKIFSIETFNNINQINHENIDAIIISTPPDKHLEYILYAIEKSKSAFVEASVILEGLNEANILALDKNVLIAPSCTFRFHPGIKKIKEIVRSNKYGRVTNFSYHSGQYLPDWHPWEKVTDFYVSRKEVSACREIVPFELTWIVDILGQVKDGKAFFGKTMDVGADVDDTYAISMQFDQGYGIMIVDVVSRFAARQLLLNMENGQIKWNWSNDFIAFYDSNKDKWEEIKFEFGKSQEGYNQNIMEEMYIDEINTFIKSIDNPGLWPNTLTDDIKNLKTLHMLENI